MEVEELEIRLEGVKLGWRELELEGIGVGVGVGIGRELERCEDGSILFARSINQC